MRLWRISNHLSLDGGGGLRASGRWHSRGRRVVYTTSNPATALLEVLVHLEVDVEDLPLRFRYLEIGAASQLRMESVTPPADWRENIEATREIGDQWLASERTCLLKVPSVLAPESWNVLINPRHPDASRIRILRVHEFPLDTRLLR